MNKPDVQLVQSASLPYLLSIPDQAEGPLPLLCFLHGYDEGAPEPIEQALQKHGPLYPGNDPSVREEFIIAAPQLPAKGDLWRRCGEEVRYIVQEVQCRHRADRGRCYLTGFSFGGDGVFDIALEQPGLWAALWPVDPTRVPEADPGLPIWFSSGAASRGWAGLYISRLRLQAPGTDSPGERVYEDRGQDHVATARLAYQEERIYQWLLKHRLSGCSE